LSQGVLPISRSQLPGEVLAGLTLAALAIPEVMGYTRIAGTPLDRIDDVLGLAS
jgi:MFS superfamily sulfate permease-like transporter